MCPMIPESILFKFMKPSPQYGANVQFENSVNDMACQIIDFYHSIITYILLYVIYWCENMFPFYVTLNTLPFKNYSCFVIALVKELQK